MKSIFEGRFPILETKHLILREPDILDRDRLFEIFSNENILKYYGMFPLNEISQAERIINNFKTSFSTENAIRWAIILKETGELIGTCGYHNWNKLHKRAEVGYELSDKFWRRGYITEAVSCINEFGFNKMKLNRIEAVVYPENFASHKSLEKLGFTKEGLLRSYTIFRNKPQDLIMYSLLKLDFHEINK